MTAQQFEDLKDFILARNTYFNKGYANAFRDDNGLVMVQQKKQLVPVSVNDKLGNYFYMRLDGDISINPTSGLKVKDANGGLGYYDSARVQLVAFMKDADEYILINNLRTTVTGYSGISCVPVGANLIRESIIRAEHSGVATNDVQAMLQRLKNLTVVRLTIEITAVQGETCTIYNPCKTC